MTGPSLRWLAIAAALLMTACAPQVTPDPPPAPSAEATPYLPPDERPSSTQTQACADRGGTYQRAGRVGGLHCIVRYADAGKRCTDGAQCQGDCRLTDVAAMPRDGTAAVGVCQADSNRFGCYATITDGKADAAICVD